MNRRSTAAVTAGLLVTVVVAGPAVADVRVPPPVSVVAMPGDGSAEVSWKDVLRRGGGLTQYTITAAPGNATATTTATSATVTGLTNGVAYTFRVTATTSTGTSAPSAPSAPVVPSAAG